MTLWMRRSHALLAMGLLTPAIGCGAILTGMAAFPGFDQATQYISELGGAEAPASWIFNLGMAVCGLGAMAAGAGFGLAVVGLGGSRPGAVATAVTFAIAGAGVLISAIFPYPDLRHQWINLGLAIVLAPGALLWGLARVAGLGRLKGFLVAALTLMIVLLILARHLFLPGLITDANVGWWERGLTLAMAGWPAVAALALQQRLARALAERAGA